MEIYSVFEIDGGLRTESAVVDRCVTEIERYIGADFFASDLDLTYFGPENLRTADEGEKISCVLFKLDKSPLVESKKADG